MKDTATLLITCPDKKGIVATVADFLYKHNANILHADEHQDSEKNLFFLRTQWDMSGFALSRKKFEVRFAPIADKFQMKWKIFYSTDKPKIAIFASKEEHCLSDLLYRHKSKELNCGIPLIISNHPDAKALSGFHGIPFYEIDMDKDNKTGAEQRILSLLKKNNVDLVVLARYMRILSENFIHEFGNPIINIHHSFLPAFVGSKPYHQAYERGVKVIGATAHYVTADLDQGPIIGQDVLRVSHRDSVGDLAQKGKDIEKIVLSRAVKLHIENRVLTYGNKTVVFD